MKFVLDIFDLLQLLNLLVDVVKLLRSSTVLRCSSLLGPSIFRFSSEFIEKLGLFIGLVYVST